jgi:hypothetical protein
MALVFSKHGKISLSISLNCYGSTEPKLCSTQVKQLICRLESAGRGEFYSRPIPKNAYKHGKLCFIMGSVYTMPEKVICDALISDSETKRVTNKNISDAGE